METIKIKIGAEEFECVSIFDDNFGDGIDIYKIPEYEWSGEMFGISIPSIEDGENALNLFKQEIEKYFNC